MTTLAEIAAGLKSRLDTISGLSAYDHSAASPSFPAALVIPPEINYREAMRAGVVSQQWEIVVLVGAADHANQKALFDYLDWSGPASVVAAIDADKTLGLIGVDANVMTSRPLGLEEVAGYGAFGASLTVQIVVTNTG